MIILKIYTDFQASITLLSSDRQIDNFIATNLLIEKTRKSFVLHFMPDIGR
jgi:hypothetical protein